MALSSVTNTVNTLHNSIHRRIITNGTVRTVEVIVYRTRQTDTTEIMFLCELHCTCQRTITTNNHQGINTFFYKIIVCSLTSFNSCKGF